MGYACIHAYSLYIGKELNVSLPNFEMNLSIEVVRTQKARVYLPEYCP
jgi:hypothetical protein